LCKDIHKRGHIWLVVVFVSDHLMKRMKTLGLHPHSERVVLDFESITITQLMIDICDGGTISLLQFVFLVKNRVGSCYSKSWSSVSQSLSVSFN